MNVNFGLSVQAYIHLNKIQS